MSLPRYIPTVTPSDLKTFHTLHFQPTSTQSQPPHQATPDLEDHDELGHYPDGTPRTLTDAQIAMFRHSEIYTLIRRRQVESENAAADTSPGSLSPTPSAHAVTAVTEQEDLETTKPASSSRGKRKRSPPPVHAREGGRAAKRNITARGVVRNLDAAAVGEQELDYGDESMDALVAEGADSNAAMKQAGRKIWWPVLKNSTPPDETELLSSV